jgi:Holliday junction resolvase RusA-like endonuclease
MREKHFVIPLEPIAWKRTGVSFKRKHIYDMQRNEKLASGIHFVSQMNNEPEFSKPLYCDIIFYMRIPIYKKDRHTYPFVKPDIDNLLKYYFDVMTEVHIIADDSLICKVCAIKQYDKNPRVELTLSELPLKEDYNGC